MHQMLPCYPQEAYERGSTTPWRYVMLSRVDTRQLLQRITRSERPGTTLAVFVAAQSYAEWNTGRIDVPVETLAQDANTTPKEVYRALSHLVELGALIRTRRGRYALNPEVAWSGTLVARERAVDDLLPAE